MVKQEAVKISGSEFQMSEFSKINLSNNLGIPEFYKIRSWAQTKRKGNLQLFAGEKKLTSKKQIKTYYELCKKQGFAQKRGNKEIGGV